MVNFREYQTDIIERGTEIINQHGFVYLSMEVRTGKTLTSLGIAERIGGLPSLTAGLVIITGILGAIIGTPLFNAMGMKDWRARGFAMGVTAHGIGTARAFQVNEVAGTFAAIALGLNGVVTAILVPLLFILFQ